MQYSDILLFLLGLLGVILHNLVKINEINKDPAKGNFNLRTYLKLEWASFLISVIVVYVCMLIKNEVIALESAGKFLGVGFVAVGYMAQSVLISVMGKAQKIIEK